MYGRCIFHVSNIFFPLLCLKAASHLAVLSDKYQMNISLDYLGGLFMEAQPLFYKWQERHYKIIMLLLQPLGARQVLCQVKGHQSNILECADMWVWPVEIKSVPFLFLDNTLRMITTSFTFSEWKPFTRYI